MKSAFADCIFRGISFLKRFSVIGLGDSLTQGVGDELKKVVFWTSDRKMNDWKGVKDVDADNLAKRGRRSDQLINQLEDPEIQACCERSRCYLFDNWWK